MRKGEVMKRKLKIVLFVTFLIMICCLIPSCTLVNKELIVTDRKELYQQEEESIEIEENKASIEAQEQNYYKLNDEYEQDDIIYKVIGVECIDTNEYNIIVEVVNNSDNDIEDASELVNSKMRVEGRTEENSVIVVNSIALSKEETLVVGSKARVLITYQINKEWSSLYVTLGDAIYYITKDEEVEKPKIEDIEGKLNKIVEVEDISFCITNVVRNYNLDNYNLQESDGKEVLRFVVEIINNSKDSIDLSYIDSYIKFEAMTVDSKVIGLKVEEYKGFNNIIEPNMKIKAYIDVIATINWNTLNITYKPEIFKSNVEIKWIIYPADIMQQEEVVVEEIYTSKGKTVHSSNVACSLVNIEEKDGATDIENGVVLSLDFEILNTTNKNLDASLVYNDMYCKYSIDGVSEIAKEIGNSSQGSLGGHHKLYYKTLYEVPANWDSIELIYTPSYVDNSSEIHILVNKNEIQEVDIDTAEET